MDQEDQTSQPKRQAKDRVKVVGPCKAGKSILVAGLRAQGYDARSCAQEHSDVPTMWQSIAPADWLIYLDVSLETMRARTPRDDWSEGLLARQHGRLAHARQHCDLYLATDDLSPQQVLARSAAFLEKQAVQRRRP